MQRDKGKAGERECARTLTALTGRKVERLLGAERDGGCDLKGLPPQFAVEVKRHKVRAYPSWQRQAEENATGDKAPVIFYRLDKQTTWYARCRLSDILWDLGLERDAVPDEREAYGHRSVWITMTMTDWVDVHGLKREPGHWSKTLLDESQENK